MDENEAKEMDVVKCVLPWSWSLVLGPLGVKLPRLGSFFNAALAHHVASIAEELPMNP